jgi:hypothetical protein
MADKLKAPLPDDKPTAAQVGLLRAYLARMGYTPVEANALVKTAKTMRTIGQDIAADMRVRQPAPVREIERAPEMTMAAPEQAEPKPFSRVLWVILILIVMTVVIVAALEYAGYIDLGALMQSFDGLGLIGDGI